ncbi:2,3-diketo-5-methylthio-1-phosphopentane phosphatase [Plectosphaerella plurivora]|uniref:2,3-diketo-5-methylthio-1-phosphopentane phosphatase n=1 Tax=Plectosphaerella plurivora TaxID=936078 RepID=A0A9P9A4Y0_9PEZI|nr:2,3-diketo-5-methylthio-1-phosphopentane phosphatase [Plectosphaerella plurivora]
MAKKLDGVRVVLLDIEGTVCPISFVKEVLYPYSVAALPSALDKHWDSPDFAPYRTGFPEPAASSRAEFEACFADLVRADVKVAHLKALQGFLWRAGYESGEVRAPLFADVAPAMSSWVSAGLKVMIYSSGSVPAQKLFFRYTDSHPSDQSPLISDWFDTVNAGSKVEASSYQRIQSCHAEFKAHEWLFLSDNLNEVQAAQDAGMQSLPVVRPGNAELPTGHPLAESVVSDFGELALGHA